MKMIITWMLILILLLAEGCSNQEPGENIPPEGAEPGEAVNTESSEEAFVSD